MFGLEDKTIWVIGAAGYLGQSVVKQLNTSAKKVLCVDIDERVDNFIASVSNNGNLSSAILNTRNTALCAGFVQQQIEKHGVPDGLVDLTYASTSKSFDDLTADDFDAVNHGGVTSTFIMAREVGNAMKQGRGGSIVLFSSMYGSVSPDPKVYEAPMNVNPIEYGVSKAGIIQMTRYMAVHYGKHNIRCNCISPGPFPNPGVQHSNPDFIERLSAKVPLGRIGQPDEIAGCVQFLLSKASSFVNGHNLFADGGWTAW